MTEPRLPVIVADPYLLNGRPWGHGATAVREAHKGEPCDECPATAKRGQGRHLMPDGATLCRCCAIRRCAANGYPTKETAQ